MTRSIVEEWGLLVKWPSKNDAHRWRRSDDRRTMRPTGRGEYGNNRVQEIVSGTQARLCLSALLLLRHKNMCLARILLTFERPVYLSTFVIMESRRIVSVTYKNASDRPVSIKSRKSTRH